MVTQWEYVSHFGPGEFSRPERMEGKLVRALDRAREFADVPFVLTSTYRDGDNGAHGHGWAVDIRCHDSRSRYHILRGLIKAGFHRIGVYDRHIHADMDPNRAPKVVWTGVSQ